MIAVVTMMVMIFSLQGRATVVAGASDCPVQFEGRIKEIIEPVGTSEAFSVNNVVIENQRSLKGEPGDQIVLSVLQNGPFKLEANKDYRVQLRNGKLCWIEEI